MTLHLKLKAITYWTVIYYLCNFSRDTTFGRDTDHLNYLINAIILFKDFLMFKVNYSPKCESYENL